MRRLVAGLVPLLLAGTALAGCGAALQELARDTCAELEGAIVLQVGPILSRAVAEAEDAGRTGSELGDAMRAECPETMAAISDINDQHQEREKLPSQMNLTVLRCNKAGSAGSVINNSKLTVDLTVNVQYLRAGTLVDDGVAIVNGLRPGETGIWETDRYREDGVDQCRADVGSAWEH